MLKTILITSLGLSVGIVICGVAGAVIGLTGSIVADKYEECKNKNKNKRKELK